MSIIISHNNDMTKAIYIKYLIKVSIIILWVQILADFENSGFMCINFSDFAITCSINWKMCDIYYISGYNF